MKRFIFLLFVGLITSFIIVSCNKKEDKIIGKWQNVLMVVKSTEGMYTTDMTKYPPTYNVFKKDNTLQITSGKFKENVQYFIQNDQLFSLRPGESSPSIMDINKLTKDELILNLKYHDQYQKEVTLYYKRVE
ncbi:MAG: hypothetical protein PHN41_00775 [Bacteroidales bacterium]|nr:hypothetical protein [Bacteroidales bacterium]MDD4703044.1 hypothetical protein [Bacteroidales bacterium]MDX9797354.1 hypothetical protein [Bacteroidales bacterium]